MYNNFLTHPPNFFFGEKSGLQRGLEVKLNALEKNLW